MAQYSQGPRRLGMALALVLFVGPGLAFGQGAAPEDQAIDTIRTLPQISASDQRRIADWVQIQVDKLKAAPKDSRQVTAQAFRKSLTTQFENSTNTPAFKAQLAAQTAQIVVAQYAQPGLDHWAGFGLARVLVDFNLPEAQPAYVAGLKSPLEVVRYLSADGLVGIRTAVSGDKEKLDTTVAALRDAAASEQSGQVLARIYAALAMPNQIAAVFDAFLNAFEKRLAARRGQVAMVDGAEVEAFEYFRTPAVFGVLTPEQKAALARPLAVFLRMDAERYNTEGLRFNELDRIERSLDANESLLSDIGGAGKGGKIRDELAAGGHDRRAAVLAEAYKWVGNPDSKEAGVLNAAPFNVPLGAP